MRPKNIHLLVLSGISSSTVDIHAYMTTSPNLPRCNAQRPAFLAMAILYIGYTLCSLHLRASGILLPHLHAGIGDFHRIDHISRLGLLLNLRIIQRAFLIVSPAERVGTRVIFTAIIAYRVAITMHRPGFLPS